MSLAVDASSPTAAIGSGASTVTGAFTPPDNTLLVAFCQGDANNGSLDEDQTVADSTSTTWTKKILRNGNGGACVTVHYRRIVGTSPGSITATLTDTKGSVAKRIFVRVFIDAATGVAPDIGTTGVSGATTVSLTTTVNNSWVWSACLTANATLSAGSGCTLQDSFGGFDSGDAVATYSQTSTTSTAGTGVTNTIAGTATVPHNVAVEIIPGGGETNYAGPWTGPTPGRLGPTGQWTTQTFDTSSAIAVALADTGSTAEALAVTAAVALADAGAETEALAVTAAVPLADAGSAADTLTAAAAVPLADAGSAADAMVAGIAISPADAGAGADSLGVTAAAPLADAGSATQTLAVTATAGLADTGTAVEAMTVVVTLALADGGSASDTATGGAAGATNKSLADGGSVADSLCVCRTVLRPNTGTVTRPFTGTVNRCDC